MTSDKNAIARYRRTFDRLAKTTVPADRVLDHLEVLAVGLREQAASLSVDAQDWLDQILRMGRFSRLPREREWPDRRRRQVEEELKRAGVAEWSGFGHFLARWPDAEATTVALQVRHFT